MATLSITAGVLDIIASQGKTWAITITARDANNNLVDFSGYSAQWHVRQNASDTNAILSLATSGSGITMSSLGVITITASATQTAAIPASSYLHELEITDPSGNKPPFLAGNLKVVAEIVK